MICFSYYLGKYLHIKTRFFIIIPKPVFNKYSEQLLLMGQSLSAEHELSKTTNGRKAVMLFKVVDETIRPVSIIDFLEKPLNFTTNPLFVIEPNSFCDAKCDIYESSKKFDKETIKIILRHFVIDSYVYENGVIWHILPNKVAEQQSKNAKEVIKKAKLTFYRTTKAFDYKDVFEDITDVFSIQSLIPKNQPSTTIRSSSPVINSFGFKIPTCNKRKSLTRPLPLRIPQTFAEEKKPDIEDMTQITPNIYIGTQRAASNKEYLLNHKITHVINLNASNKEYEFADTFEYYHVKVADKDFIELPAEFYSAAEFINDAVNRNCVILVHCQQGLCRSPALVAYYLATSRNISLDEAINLIREKRPYVNINDGFLAELRKKSGGRAKLLS